MEHDSFVTCTNAIKNHKRQVKSIIFKSHNSFHFITSLDTTGYLQATLTVKREDLLPSWSAQSDKRNYGVPALIIFVC